MRLSLLLPTKHCQKKQNHLQTPWTTAVILPPTFCLTLDKTPGFLASGGEELKPGPEMRLDRSELLCNKLVLKYKGDKASDTNIRGG